MYSSRAFFFFFPQETAVCSISCHDQHISSVLVGVEDIRKSLCVFLGHLSSGSIYPGISVQSTFSYTILSHAEGNGYTLPFDTFHNKAREFLINHILSRANCEVGEGKMATTLIYFSSSSLHF